jgi:hypothetical protein
MSDSLDADRIAAQCSAVENGLVIEVVAETASTNADLRQRIDQLRSPVLVVRVVSGAQRLATVCVFHWPGRFHAG